MRITDDCMACGQCEEICANGAIVPRPGSGYRQMMIDPARCTECHMCVDTFDCPGEAIRE
jgi:ferredoxin